MKLPKDKHHLTPKHRGGTDADGLVEVTKTQHAMFHFCEYQLWGHWEDKVAWKALAGQMNQEEISEEVKKQQYKKISEANKGVPKSEEHKKATGRANKVAYQNEELRKRCSETATKLRGKSIICNQTGVVYSSLAEAARCCNIHRGSIQRSLRNGTYCRKKGSKGGRTYLGKQYGYTFSYI